MSLNFRITNALADLVMFSATALAAYLSTALFAYSITSWHHLPGLPVYLLLAELIMFGVVFQLSPELNKLQLMATISLAWAYAPFCWPVAMYLWVKYPTYESWP